MPGTSLIAESEGAFDCTCATPIGMSDLQLAQVWSFVCGRPASEFKIHSPIGHAFIDEFVQRRKAKQERESESMPIFVSDTKQYPPAPEGRHIAVCSDVRDIGEQDTPWGKKRMVEIWFQIEALREDGERHRLRSRYTATLNERGNLRKALESWRGRRFSETELAQFDIETLKGVNAEINVVHNVTDQGKRFANISTILPPLKDAKKLEPIVYEQKAPVQQQATTGDDRTPF